MEHVHPPRQWDVDPAMGPLVRAYVTAAENMRPHVDDAAKGFALRGWLDPIRLVKELPWEREWETPLREAWELSAARVMRRAWVRPEKRVLKDVTAEVGLSMQEELGLTFLEENGATLVRQLSAQNRRAMVAILDKAIREGWSIPRIVRNIRDLIGLLPKQVAAVTRRQRVLEQAGATEDRIGRDVARYAKRLLKQRAENIARTETVRALNTGQLQAWKQQQGDQQLPQTVKRVWIPAVDERTCPICMELGAMPPVGLNEGWASPSVGFIRTPPAHPSCRCSMGLV